MTTQDFFWTFIDWDGDRYEDDFPDEQAALTAAQNSWDRHCEDVYGDDAANGETHDEFITLVKFKLDENDEPVDVETKQHCVQWEYYHGDLAEHGTWNKHGTGCI